MTLRLLNEYVDVVPLTAMIYQFFRTLPPSHILPRDTRSGKLRVSWDELSDTNFLAMAAEGRSPRARLGFQPWARAFINRSCAFEANGISSCKA